jgi:hemolysin III
MASSVETIDRPVWRGWMHAVAFFCSLPAGFTLVVLAEGATQRTAAAIYAVSLSVMFGTSAAYHVLARSEVARRRMQRADHSMIFLLIAGTYVPMAIVVLPREWGIPILAVVCALAVVGIAMKLGGFERTHRVSYVLYPLMGWTALAAMPVLIDHLTTVQLGLIVAGGLMYTFGIPVLVLRRPNPWPKVFGYHEVWHSFVTVAAVLHFAAVAAIVT